MSILYDSRRHLLVSGITVSARACDVSAVPFGFKMLLKLRAENVVEAEMYLTAQVCCVLWNSNIEPKHHACDDDGGGD